MTQTCPECKGIKIIWADLYQSFSRLVDGFGTPLDSGIIDAVVALNAVGIHTTASCEGHLNWGLPYPWIDIGADNADTLEDELAHLRMQDRQASDGEISLSEETEQLQTIVKQLHAKEQYKLINCLDEFYKQRIVDCDRHLVFLPVFDGESRLRSQGADLQEIRDFEERESKLREYQQEMWAFAEFLKGKFLGIAQQDLSGIRVGEILDTSGALLILSQRLGRSYSPDTLHYHVREGNLPSYLFINAELVRSEPGKRRPGQVHYFLKQDLYQLSLNGKRGRKPKTFAQA